MSIVLITEHDESIYNVIKPDGTVEQPDLTNIEKEYFKTKYHTTDVKETKLMKKLRRRVKTTGIMGLPKQPPIDPHKYLKKKSGGLALGGLIPQCEPYDIPKKVFPPVPPRDETIKEQSAKIKHKKKNYIIDNIRNNIKMVPKTPKRRINVTVTGDAHELGTDHGPRGARGSRGDGGYGTIPRYLDTLIKVKDKATQVAKDKHGVKQPKCVYITREERENLLTGLKQNWEELQRVYQGLPILTDTIPKKQRKSKIEDELKQLEKDIVLIERHPYIYVYDDKKDL